MPFTPHNQSPPRRRRTAIGRCLGMVLAIGVAAASIAGIADPAWAAGAQPAPILAAPSLEGVVNNLRVWLVGILAAVATLFLTIGGLRYLAAGGDPGQVEKAKSALKSAAIGYALALLAPVLISLVAQLVK